MAVLLSVSIIARCALGGEARVEKWRVRVRKPKCTVCTLSCEIVPQRKGMHTYQISAMFGFFFYSVRSCVATCILIADGGFYLKGPI